MKFPMLNLFKAPQYQLVLEFQDDSPENFERVIAIEAKLEELLQDGEVDGNDFGQGIVNIFIITKHPEKCFEEAMLHIKGFAPNPSAAGYRNVNEDDYVRVWPQGDSTPFELR
jgi:hypothetical protein